MTNTAMPLSRAIMVYSMIDFADVDKPVFRSYNNALAYDPTDHTFAAVGLTFEAYRELENIVLKHGSGYHAKWAGYVFMTKGELVESYRSHFAPERRAIAVPA